MELREKEEKKKEDNNILKRFISLYQKKCAGKKFIESRYARKDIADIHILITFGKKDHNTEQFIRIPSKPSTRKRKRNQFSWFWRISFKVMTTKRPRLVTFQMFRRSSTWRASSLFSVTGPKTTWSNEEYHHPRHKNMHDQMVNLFINFPRKSVISEKRNFMDSITVPILKTKFYQLRQCNNSSLVKIRKPILTIQKTTFHLKADRLVFTSTTPAF